MFSVSVIGGSLIGLSVSVVYILLNRYVRYGMGRLSVVSLQESLGRWVAMALLGGAVFLVLGETLGLVKRTRLGGKVTSLFKKKQKAREMAIFGLMFVGFFSAVEWALNYFWLSYRVRPIGMSFHGGILLLSMLAGWLLGKIHRPRGIKNPAPRIAHHKYTRGTALVSLLFLLVLNVFEYTDRKGNPPGGPNIIILLSDALRKDHLGCYGYGRKTSPHIDAFAREAALFTRAYAQSPSTKPSVASLFTSLYPTQHRVIYNEDALPLSCLTLAEVLRENRYLTAGFFENWNLSGKFRYNQGFDTWTWGGGQLKVTEKSMEQLDRRILSWLERHREDSFFLYIHLLDPHNPYRAPPPFYNFFDGDYRGEIDGHESGPEYIAHYRENRRDLEHLIALYDDEIRYMDYRVDKILNKLEELDILEKSVVIFLSDHGEEFLDHGNLRHSTSVYAELIDIPLIIRYPQLFKKGEIRSCVQHIDIFPTLLAALNIDPSPFCLEGNDISAGTRENRERRKESPTIMCEHLIDRKKREPPQRCVLFEGWKLVHHIRSDTYSLFDTRRDPTDSKDLIRRDDVMAGTLKARLTNRLKRLEIRTGGRKVRLDEETKSKLKTLGYIR